MAPFYYDVNMDLKDIRISKELTQLEASLICSVSLRTYKRLELDPKYKETDKYKEPFNRLKYIKIPSILG